MRQLRASAVMTFVAMCALAGCGGSDEESRSSENPAPRAEAYTVETALRSLPSLPTSEGNPLFVSVGDLVAATELADVDLPTDGPSAATWFRALTTGPVHVEPNDTLQNIASGQARAALGFDVADVSGVASVMAVEESVTVYRLTKGAAPEQPKSFTGEGAAGDIDPASKENSAFRVVQGIGQRGDDVALSKYPAALAAWISGDEVLAANGELLEVARALDAEGVYSALLTDGRGVPKGAIDQEEFDQLGSTVVPPFNAAGVGQAVVDGTAVEYIAYQLDDAPSAKDTIEASWRDGLALRQSRALSTTLDVDEVVVTGNVVVVRITGKTPKPGLAATMLARTDGPFLTYDTTFQVSR